MLAAVRIAAVVAVIFYLSPVRRANEAPLRPGAVLEGVRDGLLKGPARDGVATMDALLRKLPETAKQAVVEEVRAHALGSAKPPGVGADPAVARDTLEFEDLQPAWRGGPKDHAAGLPPRPRDAGARLRLDGQRPRQ
jgi:hypothetical protein